MRRRHRGGAFRARRASDKAGLDCSSRFEQLHQQGLVTPAFRRQVLRRDTSKKPAGGTPALQNAREIRMQDASGARNSVQSG
jgi:hypothetical protein